jgi:RNA polymerase sigma factor (sigma-70 family)
MVIESPKGDLEGGRPSDSDVSQCAFAAIATGYRDTGGANKSIIIAKQIDETIYKQVSIIVNKQCKYSHGHGLLLCDEGDVIQEVFVRLIGKKRSGAADADLSIACSQNFIRVLANRIIIDALRRSLALRRGTTGCRINVDIAEPVDYKDEFKQIEDRDSIRAITRCVSVSSRVILALFLDGYTHQQIAAKLGISVSSVVRKLRLIRCVAAQFSNR